MGKKKTDVSVKSCAQKHCDIFKAFYWRSLLLSTAMNLLTFGFMFIFLIPFFFSPEEQKLWHLYSSQLTGVLRSMDLFSNVGSFIVPAALLLIFLGILRRGFSDEATPEEFEKAQARILNFPSTASKIAISGWAFAAISHLFIRIYFMPPEMNRVSNSAFFIIAVTTDFAFIVNYYAFVLFNARWTVPRFFPENKLSHIRGSKPTPLKKQFFMLWSAIFLFPMLILIPGFMGRIYEVSESAGVNAMVHGLWAFFPMVLMTFFVALLMQKSLRQPVSELGEAARKVGEGDYNIEIPVRSNCEVGKLAETINEMAKGLREKQALEIERNVLRERNFLLEQELDLARRMQMRFIPQVAPMDDIAFYYQPMQKVGGDFFNFIELSGDEIGLFISDVSGHGVPAAFITSMIYSFTAQFALQYKRPSEFLMNLNSFLYGQTDGNFVTAFYGIYNIRSKHLLFSNAGHNAPYRVKNGETNQLQIQRSGLALAVVEGDTLADMGKAFSDESLVLSQGEKLLFYTDGLTEAVSQEEKFDKPEGNLEDFERVRLPRILSEISAVRPREAVTKLISDLTSFRGSSDFDDDVCVVMLEAS